MKKRLKIVIWILIIWIVFINIISVSNRITFIDNEKSELLKKQFNLPDNSQVFATIIPKLFFRPSFKMIYLDGITIHIQNTGKLGERDNNAFKILPDMIKNDIFQYIWIFNIINITILITIIVIYKIKYHNNKVVK